MSVRHFELPSSFDPPVSYEHVATGVRISPSSQARILSGEDAKRATGKREPVLMLPGGAWLDYSTLSVILNWMREDARDPRARVGEIPLPAGSE